MPVGNAHLNAAALGVAGVGRVVAQGSSDLHWQLRSATHDAHRRLHRHPGFAAVQDGTIDRAAYTALLRRLQGFHQPFEIAAGLAPTRSGRIASDLAALGSVAPKATAPIALCRDIPDFGDHDDIVGAIYVVEGAALGGRGLARHLDALLGADAIDGRRFFSGNGADTGAAWRAYLAQLANVSPDWAVRRRVVSAAVVTFAVFEDWLGDWDK